MYADNQQIYLSFKPSKAGDKENSIKRLEMCISEIKEWMIVNKLKLNNDKMEFIVFGTKQQLSKIGEVSINISSVQIQPVDHVRNLGYHMDQLLKNGPHINKLVSNLYLQLKSIYRLCKKLDQKSCKIIIQAIIQSKLDYCNSLLLRTSEFQLHKLQQIQNMACRIVCILRRYDHITDSMKDLHWLKVHQRIHYKVACFMFNCIRKTAPKYLMELKLPVQHNRQLRSSVSDRCNSTYSKTAMAYKSSFASAGPRIWNSLPSNIRKETNKRTFHKLLKTYLFGQSYIG